MSPRTKRKKKVVCFTIQGGNQYFKMRLIPWMRLDSGVVWLASLAVAKSKRQINDWLEGRQKRSVKRLSSNLTGKSGNQIQAIAIRQVRQWLLELPPGDGMTLRCECALSDKQFQVWNKWFMRHEDPSWIVNPEFKSFYIYKKHTLE